MPVESPSKRFDKYSIVPAMNRGEVTIEVKPVDGNR
jgi:hypothetical protein